MQHREFTLPRDDVALVEFEADPEIMISSRKAQAFQSNLQGAVRWEILVFYDFAKDLEEKRDEKETARLQSLKAIAATVARDEGYAGLKNTRQREIWLQDRYGMYGHDAADVIELAKPEMAGVLSAARGAA